MTTSAEHRQHESTDHGHVHGETCGHDTVQHGDAD